MYRTHSTVAAARSTTAVALGERSTQHAGQPARHPYAERDTGVGYGRSSGYAARDGYKGRAYVRMATPALFRFS